mmetsp:Transcript_67702/g.198150  ORF Transcript_67702/g.198150 Transcript_67702/m.198150 type:complete len:1253 (+) Transcript_67702:110-3868(+)
MPPSLDATEKTPLAPSMIKNTAGTFADASGQQGLSAEEAAKRLAEDGPNSLDPPEKESFWGILLTQMKNMIFLLTLCAACLSWLVGDEVKSSVMIGIVCFVCLANTIGEYSAQDASEALAKMSAPKARVIRSGKEEEVSTKELVVGDVVKIFMGDVVPADMVLVSCTDLQTNEAALTGEAHEQVKTTDSRMDSKSTFKENMVYASTSVVSGKGLGEVVATGMCTEMGLIAKRLKHRDETLSLNPLQKSINLLGTLIGSACITVATVATLISYWSKYQNPMSPCADDDGQCLLATSLVRGLILAVSIIPAGLPFIVMVMLRVGSSEMAKRHAVVTRQSAVDYLGATTVVCTDKTGTLTEGKMTAEVVVGLCQVDPSGPPTESSLAFYPLRGASPNGGLFRQDALTAQEKRRMDTDFNPRERRQTFSEPALPDLAEAEEATRPDAAEDALLARAHLVCCFLNCYETTLCCDRSTGWWSTQGNMTEGALKVAAAKGGLWDEEGLGPELLQVTHPRVAELEVPFNPKRKMMATVHRLPPSRRLEVLQFPEGATHVAVVKGAPDKILPKVSQVAGVALNGEGKVLEVSGERPLSEDGRAALRRRNDELSQRALRSILLAVRPLTQQEVESMQASTADERLAALLRPSGLCFLSLWGISDPPRAMVPRSVEECHRAGIRVVMITGDQRPTALAVGRQVHILEGDVDAAEGGLDCTELHEGRPMMLTPSRARRVSKTTAQLLAEIPEEDLAPSLTTSPRLTPSPPLTPSAERTLTVHDLQSEKDDHERRYRSSHELAFLTSNTNVWSRAHPTDKVAIVASLTEQGHVTAMTGDGVNDAPALKHASVGVSMGIAGTEVAKSASELILMDDDFSTIVAAIREGRKIYANVQKYVVFNLSIKAGECVSLLTAIGSGVPMPIRGLQLLFNLVFTHIIPTMALAWEQEESYLMTVPPRKTKRDLVVPPVMWLFRWLPFVLCMPVVVLSCLSVGVWMHTGFLRGNSIIGTSRVGALDQGLFACELAGRLDLDGRFIDDLQPFHCQCFTHPSGLPWTAAVAVEQWGAPVPAEEVEALLDPWTGSTGKLFDKDRTPWKDGVEALVEPCVDRRKVKRWCWKAKALPAEERPVLPLSLNCAAYGARLGQSMAYATIHLGEILSLLTFRMDGFFLSRTFSNPVFNGLLIFNLCCLSTFLYAWPVAGVLELAPLTLSRFAVVLFFDLCLVSLNEAFKVLYREQLRKRNAVLEVQALEQARGGKAKAVTSTV